MTAAPSYSFRDARLRARPLLLMNRVGDALRKVGITRPSLAPDSIVAAAKKASGCSDLGSQGYREALEVFCDSAEREADLTTFGRMAIRGMVVSALANRARVLDWAKRHPEVREERIPRPWVICGLPRTGTSLLSILLGLDPVVRPLLHWEAGEPVPPPDLATQAEDPRIAKAAKQYTQLAKLNPPIQAMHPFGATIATECVTLLAFDLRTLSFETQALVPSYGAWLEKTDMREAYGFHRLGLQILQSRIPTEAWCLKTPNHLWCLDTLLESYPDARIIWTHRDPAKVVPSVASLNTTFHRLTSRSPDPVAVAADWNHKLHLAVSRGVAFDQRREGASWCAHMLYADLMGDPIGTVRRLYAHFGEEVSPLHARRMETWMRDRPQEVFGRHVYDIADFDLSVDGIHTQYAEYIDRFGVPRE